MPVELSGDHWSQYQEKFLCWHITKETLSSVSSGWLSNCYLWTESTRQWRKDRYIYYYILCQRNLYSDYICFHILYFVLLFKHFKESHKSNKTRSHGTHLKDVFRLINRSLQISTLCVFLNFVSCLPHSGIEKLTLTYIIPINWHCLRLER